MTGVAEHDPATRGSGAQGELPAVAYRRGYTAPARLRESIAAAHRTRWWLTCLAGLGDHAVMYALLLGSVWVELTHPAFAVPAALLALVGIGRGLRALECLIHEGSHFNWSRPRRRLNDAGVLLLCGLPTSIHIAEYRASHLRHHGRFGTAADPDRWRYVELDIESIRRDSSRALAAALIRRLPRYQLGWLRELRTSPVYLLMPLGWAAVVVGLPAGLLFGPAGAALAAGTWLVGWMVALPVIRFLGESSEHVYTAADTVFDTTISNLGPVQRLFFHPHNDGYHTVHHMWPGVPHHALRKLHNLLVEQDWEHFGSRVPYRSRLLEDAHRAPAGR